MLHREKFWGGVGGKNTKGKEPQVAYSLIRLFSSVRVLLSAVRSCWGSLHLDGTYYREAALVHVLLT